MKTSLFVALLALTWAANAPAKDQTKQDNQADQKQQEQKICRRQEQIGSRLLTHRVCMTKEQWKKADEQARQDAQDVAQRAAQGPAKY